MQLKVVFGGCGTLRRVNVVQKTLPQMRSSGYVIRPPSKPCLLLLGPQHVTQGGQECGCDARGWRSVGSHGKRPMRARGSLPPRRCSQEHGFFFLGAGYNGRATPAASPLWIVQIWQAALLPSPPFSLP